MPTTSAVASPSPRPRSTSAARSASRRRATSWWRTCHRHARKSSRGLFWCARRVPAARPKMAASPTKSSSVPSSTSPKPLACRPCRCGIRRITACLVMTTAPSRHGRLGTPATRTSSAGPSRPEQPAMLAPPPSAHSMLTSLRSYGELCGRRVANGPAVGLPIVSSKAATCISHLATSTPRPLPSVSFCMFSTSARGMPAAAALWKPARGGGGGPCSFARGLRCGALLTDGLAKRAAAGPGWRMWSLGLPLGSRGLRAARRMAGEWLQAAAARQRQH